MGPYPWGWQHRDLAGTKGSGSLAAGPLRRGGKATKNQFSRRKYCEFSSLGYVDASSLPNAFCSAFLRCARGMGCGCKSGVSLLVPYGYGQGTGAVPGGCPSRTAGAAAPPGCWGLACPLTLPAAAVAAGATKGLPKRRHCHVDALARGSHLDVFAQLHKTNTPTEQLGCGILGFTDPFLSLPPNPLLVTAHAVGPYGVFPGDADNGSHILRFPPVQWDCTTIKMPITGPL